MAMTANGGSMAITTVYQEVKAWIARQEAFEAQYNKPAPLTDVQRMALEALRLPTFTPSSSPPPPPPPPPPPHAAATASAPNYIGILTEYHQKRNQLHGLHWVEETSGTLPGGVTGRVCRVTIAESFSHESGHIDHFPAMEYGLNDDGSEVRFNSKKAAKQFAARCAVAWLVDQGLFGTTSPPPGVPSPLYVASGLKRASQGASSTITTPPPKRQIMAAPVGLDGGSEAAAAAATGAPSLPATDLVTILCRDLGIPAPKYFMIETSPSPQTFDAKAHFDDYGDPDIASLTEVGVVRGVLGKNAAKEAVATKLLGRLREIEAERQAQLQLVYSRLGNEI